MKSCGDVSWTIASSEPPGRCDTGQGNDVAQGLRTPATLCEDQAGIVRLGAHPIPGAPPGRSSIADQGKAQDFIESNGKDLYDPTDLSAQAISTVQVRSPGDGQANLIAAIKGHAAYTLGYLLSQDGGLVGRAIIQPRKASTFERATLEDVARLCRDRRSPSSAATKVVVEDAILTADRGVLRSDCHATVPWPQAPGFVHRRRRPGRS